MTAFLSEAGECVQNILYYTETGQKKEAKMLLSKYDSLRETAARKNMEIVFFEKRSIIKKPHQNFPGLTSKISTIKYIGAWTVEKIHNSTRHFHLTLELITDGTKGHPLMHPGDIEVLDTNNEESQSTPEINKKGGNEFNERDFFKRHHLKYDFDDSE